MQSDCFRDKTRLESTAVCFDRFRVTLALVRDSVTDTDLKLPAACCSFSLLMACINDALDLKECSGASKETGAMGEELKLAQETFLAKSRSLFTTSFCNAKYASIDSCHRNLPQYAQWFTDLFHTQVAKQQDSTVLLFLDIIEQLSKKK